MRKTIISALAIGICAMSALTGVSCKSNTEHDTATTQEQLEKKDSSKRFGGFKIDKSGDSTLQAMIKEIVPKFKQYKYTVPGTDEVIQYNLYTPEKMEQGKKYPLVMFVADASTVDKEVTVPLTQGYGALVWATPESQAKNLCYVLVPEMAGGATNDSYTHSKQVDDLIGLVKQIVKDNPIDNNRLYSTGQSMGGMMAMYYDVAYPDLFAASIFVDSHWDEATFPDLVKHKFVWFIAGDGGKAYPKLKPLEEAAEKEGIQYTFSEWSAKLPDARQNELASAMLEKGAPINIIEFETGSVLPEGVKGKDYMYSFDYAYKITAVRDWLFRQSK